MKNEILVIDDNIDIRLLICNILKEKGYNIRSAINYEQGAYEINKKLTEYSNKALFQFLLSIMSHLKIDEHYFPEP